MVKQVPGFDPVLWRQQYKSTARDNPRGGMIGALKNEILKVGMPRKDIQNILGPPDIEKDDADIYSIGVSPFGIDHEQYVIEYDVDKRVIRFYLRRG